jgi:very-short-patch-repair endonuclease
MPLIRPSATFSPQAGRREAGNFGGSFMRGPNRVTTKRARAFRQTQNDAEAAMWFELRGRRLNGHKFVRQLPIGRYFVDFACRERRLVVEIDGSQHADNERDAERDRYMNASGWSVLRLWNHEALAEREACLETILAALDGRLEERIVASDLRFFPADHDR